MKKVILSLVTIGLFASLNAESLVDEGISQELESKAADTGSNSQVRVENSVITTEANIAKDAVAIGTVGSVAVEGEDVLIENTILMSEANIEKDAVAIGTIGSTEINADDVAIENSIISTTANVGEDAVAIGTIGSVKLGK